MAPIRQHKLGQLRLQTWQLADLMDVPAGELRHVVPVNAEVFALAHEIPELGRALSRAVNVVDGRLLQQIVRLTARDLRIPRSAAGADAIYPIAELLRARGARMFLLGASDEVNRKACARLRELNPGLDIAGFSPPMVGAQADESWADDALARIRSYAPYFVGVCLGPPRQEIWVDRHREALRAAGVHVAMDLGGTADYVAGAVRRPPRIVNWLGLEWLFRLIRDPRHRWRRTLTMLRTPWHVLASR